MSSTAPHQPTPPSAHQPSFARRHPILTGFGVLAGVSLFAAYFPISAIITGVVVGAHATGADRVAWRWTERAATWVQSKLHRHAASPPVSAPAPPAAPSPSAQLRCSEPSLQRARREPRMGAAPVRAARRSPKPAQRRPVAASVQRGQRDLEL
jgi:hypothetical protein